MSRLLWQTPLEWVDTCIQHFDAFLADHASCERKASAMAMSFVSHYPDKQELVEAMIALAIEELEHFRDVSALMYQRGSQLGADEKDPYVGQLLKHIRSGKEDYFLDRLLVAGVVEARGAERFGLIAEHHPDAAMAAFYQELTRSEARHGGLFLRMARLYFDQATVESRIETWFEIEAKIAQQLPIRAAVH